MKKIILILSVIVVVSLVVWGIKLSSGIGNKASVTTNAGKVASDSTSMGEAHSQIVKMAGSRIDLLDRNNLRPGKVTLLFKLYASDASELTPGTLKVAHEKKVHLIVVRDDLSVYQHLHPDYVDGRWSVQSDISEQGKYHLYLDIAPVNEKSVVLLDEVLVGGLTLKKMYPDLTPNLTAMDGGVSAKLSFGQKLDVNKDLKLMFELSRNGQPAKIDTYLGAFGHVIALRHGDPEFYLHAHNTNKEAPTDGRVEFEAMLPQKGMYTFFAQFNVNGQVKTFPITLEAGVISGGSDMGASGHMK